MDPPPSSPTSANDSSAPTQDRTTLNSISRPHSTRSINVSSSLGISNARSIAPLNGRRRSMSFSQALTPSAFASAFSHPPDDGVADAIPVTTPLPNPTEQRRLSHAALQSRQSREHSHPGMYYGHPPTRSITELTKNGIVWIDGKRHAAAHADVWQKFTPEKKKPGWCCGGEDDVSARTCLCRMMLCFTLAACLIAFMLTGIFISAVYIWQTRLPITSIALLANSTQLLAGNSSSALDVSGTLRLSIANLNTWPADISVHASYGVIGKSNVRHVHVPANGGMVDVFLPTRLSYSASSDPDWKGLKDMLIACKRLGNLAATTNLSLRWHVTLTMHLFHRYLRFSSSKLRLVPLTCLLPTNQETEFLKRMVTEFGQR